MCSCDWSWRHHNLIKGKMIHDTVEMICFVNCYKWTQQWILKKLLKNKNIGQLIHWSTIWSKQLLSGNHVEILFFFFFFWWQEWTFSLSQDQECFVKLAKDKHVSWVSYLKHHRWLVCSGGGVSHFWGLWLNKPLSGFLVELKIKRQKTLTEAAFPKMPSRLFLFDLRCRAKMFLSENYQRKVIFQTWSAIDHPSTILVHAFIFI